MTITTPKISTYQDALDYLYSFIDYERKPARTPAEAAHNLDRLRALLAALGNPQAQFHSVVIAGTKGKGSTAAILESIVRSGGYRTGLWTSPHLNSYRERIQVNRTLITQAELVALVNRLSPIIEQFDTATYGAPTTFELGFSIALCHFAAQSVHLAVIEVGLGGRYDCANVLTPLVSLVSSISYDHINVLGSTLTAIASDKAGIFKPGVPAVTVPQPAEAAAALAAVAQQVGAPLHIAVCARDAATPLCRDEHTERTPVPTLTCPVPPIPRLRGAFQRENARLACTAAVLLRQHATHPLVISDTHIQAGLASVDWPGRLEVVGQQPTIVLDGAHNGDSAYKLIQALQAEFAYHRLILVLGVSRDKQIEAILRELLPAASLLVLTHSRHPRALTDLARLAQQGSGWYSGATLFTDDVPDALALAQAHATPADLICVTGSLFVVGAAREALGVATVCD